MDPSIARTKDGFDCEFEKEPKELQSKCSICLLILREPHLTSCCGYSFCQGCIEKIAASPNSECPLCRKEFHIYPNKWLKRELYQLKVYCTHKFCDGNEGCDWVGPLEQLDEHLNSDTHDQTKGCGFVRIKCDACDEDVLRKGYGVHTSDLCNERPFSCEHCGEYHSTYVDVIFNHWPQCPYHPVECTNKCGKYTKRKDLDIHLFAECPLTSISCEFCSVQIQRGEMHKHLTDNLTTHISLMVDPLHEQMGLLSQQIDDAEERIHELSDDNQYLQGEVERLCLRAGKNEEEIHRLRQDNLETQSLYSEMYQRNTELTRNFEGLQKEYEDLKQENEVLHERTNQLSADLTRFQLKEEKNQEFTISEAYRQSPTPAKTFVHASAENTQASLQSASSFADIVKFKSTEKEKKITASKAAALNFVPISPENTQASLQSASIYATRYDDLNATSYYELSQAISLTGDLPDHQHDPSILTPPVTLIMPNYAAYSSGSKSGEYWVSKPFYSDTQPSYKLCLSVRASENLSVIIRLVRGEFDLQLDWPFNANITIKLKNHAGRGRNWERKITFRNGNRVTKGTIARGGRGDMNFITLYEDSSFVKDDTLWFEVVSIQLV